MRGAGRVAWLGWGLLTWAVGAAPPDVTGWWQGTLDIGGGQLRLLIHLTRGDDGTLGGTLSSLDQGGEPMPFSRVGLDGDTLRLGIERLSVTYTGRLSPDGRQITGTFAQQGVVLELTLQRTDGPPPPPARPQDPVEPLPYRAEDVTFDNPAAGVTLAGTLTLPEGEGPYPAVALLSGSGAQRRDADLAGHRLFLVLADHLTRHGIAVLRYDDRGVGESTGDYGAATSADFAADAAAAAEYLAARPDLRADAVGLIGLSEGGLTAPMASLQSSRVAFLVLLSPPAVSGRDILIAQASALRRGAGMPDAQVAQAEAAQTALLDAVLAGEADEPETARLARLRPLAQALLAAEGAPDNAELAGSTVSGLLGPWMSFFLRHDPADTLRQVKVPLLAVWGQRDRQVLPEQSLPVMAAALADGGHTDHLLANLPGLNHLLQPAETGMPGEYGRIELTMAPAAQELIVWWIQRHVGSAEVQP